MIVSKQYLNDIENDIDALFNVNFAKDVDMTKLKSIIDRITLILNNIDISKHIESNVHLHIIINKLNYACYFKLGIDEAITLH